MAIGWREFHRGRNTLGRQDHGLVGEDLTVAAPQRPRAHVVGSFRLTRPPRISVCLCGRTCIRAMLCPKACSSHTRFCTKHTRRISLPLFPRKEQASISCSVFAPRGRPRSSNEESIAIHRSISDLLSIIPFSGTPSVSYTRLYSSVNGVCEHDYMSRRFLLLPFSKPQKSRA